MREGGAEGGAAGAGGGGQAAGQAGGGRGRGSNPDAPGKLLFVEDFFLKVWCQAATLYSVLFYIKRAYIQYLYI